LIDDKRILGLICARGGSKGIPRKNLRPVGGRPLIGWSIASGLACPQIDRLIVSTDDSEMAEVARSLGAETPFMRPEKLATDQAPEWIVWQHAITEMAQLGFQADYLVVLPPTSPFRSHADVAQSIERLHLEDADVVLSVTESGRNPYFNMVELDTEGFASLAKKPAGRVARRQDAPRVYDITTAFYAVRCDYVLKASGLFEGKVKATAIPAIRAVDIDTALDLKFAEFLIAEGLIEIP
jgi:N,N'-diacetyl-8-epilegionaminate cytidylyltransferase